MQPTQERQAPHGLRRSDVLIDQSPVLSSRYLTCSRCGNEAEVLANRSLNMIDVPALGVMQGPACYAVLLLCAACGRAWIVLAADGGCCYGAEGGD